jgi:hypothetical protein
MHFLNVDLDIESRGDLSLLVEELGEDVNALHHGQIRGLNHLRVSSAGSSCDGGADEIIAGLCCLVRELPPEARAVWDACCTRVFDIGYDANGPEEAFRSEIRSETIQNVAAIGASIMVTIYPPDPGGDDGQ